MLVGLLYGLALARVLAPAGWNPLTLARISRDYGVQRFWDQAPPLEDGPGYDGQFFYYIARDPLPRIEEPRALDVPSYRYQRILLPVLAYGLALGSPPAIGWTLLVVNLGALALGCWGFLRLLAHAHASPLWVLAYAANPGFIIGVTNDLSEPLAVALATVGTLAYFRGRDWGAAVLFLLGVLARETVVLVPLALFGFETVRGRAPRALPYLGVGVAAVAWQLGLMAILGSLPVVAGGNNVGLPFAGVARRLDLVLAGLGQATPADWPILAADILGVGGVLLAALAAVLAFRPGSAARWIIAIQGAFVLVLGPTVWEFSLNFARAASFLFLFILITSVVERAGSRQVTVGDQAAVAAEPAEPVLGAPA